MREYLVDTNCLISFITDRNPQQQAVIAKYFENAADLEISLYVIGHVITELVYVFNKVYRVETDVIAKSLQALVETPGIELLDGFHTSLILELWPHSISDFGDAVLAAAARESQYTLLTFDRSLAKALRKLNIPHQLI
jgi:predicted nucleic-acid-binding protein